MKKLLTTIKYLITLIVFVVSILFVKGEYNNTEYQAINIIIEDSLQNRFVDRTDIVNFIRSNKGDLLGSNVNKLNLLEIERDLNGRDFIQNAEVFSTLQWGFTGPGATLNVAVDQRDPIVRIYQKGKDYYVDKEGRVLPWTNKHTARVVTAQGNIDKDFARTELLELCRFIESDPFWKAQIDQILVDASKEITLIPRVGDHTVLIGNTNQLQEKFRNLKAFYKQILPEVGWNRYRKVNVKFSNQVVCSK